MIDDGGFDKEFTPQQYKLHQTRATYYGVWVPARGQTVGCGVCDTPELG